MSRGRHSLSARTANTRRLTLIAAPAVTCAAIGIGVVATGAGDSTPLDFTGVVAAGTAAQADRTAAISRSAERLPLAQGRRWTTADLDLRLKPVDDARTRGEVDSISRIAVTGVRRNGFAQVLVKGKAYWVTAEYLAAKKPTDPAHLPVLGKPCPDGSVEKGLTAAAVRVYRAICNNFPQISQYGGWDNHGEHRSGRALDVMTSDVSLGDAVAEFLRAHAAELSLYDVIWRQRIFTPERGGEGWRAMPNRGSATANHRDHVHVSVY